MAGRSKTWWGAEFITALENCIDPGRLQRGRSYARPSRQVYCDIVDGKVEAEIIGNKNPHYGVYRTPYYDVAISFRKIPATNWRKILRRLGANANWVTHLVLGEVPPTIETAFEDSKIKLLPRSRAEIHSSCSCPDYANPCKHVAGVYFTVAAILEHDPLLLFEFRGMGREELLEAMSKSEFGAALLGGESVGGPDLEAAMRTPRLPAVAVAPGEGVAEDARAFWRGRTLPRSAAGDRQLPPLPALMLRKEGDYPAFWHRENSFLDAMSEIYDRVANSLPTVPASEFPPGE